MAFNQLPLIDNQSLGLCRQFLWQGQFKHAIYKFGARVGVINILPELEAAGDFAKVTLGSEDALAVLDFLFLLPFCRDGDGRAIDIDVNIFLANTGHFGMHDIGIFQFLDIKLDGRCISTVAHFHGAHEEAAEEVVKRVKSS